MKQQKKEKMKYLCLEATFCDNINPTQKDCYTLYGKNDIHPGWVLTYDILHPVYADNLILRNPQYSHPAIIYGLGLPPISYPDNAWAWIYNSNKGYVQLNYPCFCDILALDHSNSIVALASLVRIIAQERNLDAQGERCQKYIEAECEGKSISLPPVKVICELPETIRLRAYFNCNNEWYALYIYAQFSNNSTNIVNFVIKPFNQNAPQLVTPSINTCIGANILEAISSVIHATQLQHHVKINFDTMTCGKLVPQPVL